MNFLTQQLPNLITQAAHWTDAAKRLEPAKRFVCGAIAGMMKVTGQWCAKRGSTRLYWILHGLKRYMNESEKAADTEELLGFEGNARNCYYGLFGCAVPDEAFAMKNRLRRPPRDRMNALISFLNTICYNETLSQIYRTKLDPRISYLHSPSDRRLSLHLDIAEIFKPVLVDRLIFRLVNKRMIRAEHFENGEKGVTMTREGRRIVLNAWDERPEETTKLPSSGGRISRRELIPAEARKVQRHIEGEEKYEPFIVSR